MSCIQYTVHLNINTFKVAQPPILLFRTGICTYLQSTKTPIFNRNHQNKKTFISYKYHHLINQDHQLQPPTITNLKPTRLSFRPSLTTTKATLLNYQNTAAIYNGEDFHVQPPKSPFSNHKDRQLKPPKSPFTTTKIVIYDQHDR